MLYVYRKSIIDHHINRYFIFGERHSGTKCLNKNIVSVFGLKLNQDFGHKHFFGFHNPHDLIKNQDTLFLGIVRDPYQWIAAMNKEPHHVPSCLKPLFDHLEDEWYSIDQYYNLHDKRSYRMDRTKEILDDRSFVNGDRYGNIFELRISKLNYLVNILPNLVKNYILISYESLTLNRDLYLSIVENTFNITRKTNATLPPIHKPKIREIPQGIKNLISCNLNWTIENQIGYNRDLNI
jgi:hypothetical protein